MFRQSRSVRIDESVNQKDNVHAIAIDARTVAEVEVGTSLRATFARFEAEINQELSKYPDKKKLAQSFLL